MATEKIQEIRKEIIRAMPRMFARGYLTYVFGGKLTPDDVVTHVLIECSKRAYDNIEEKHSLRYYLNLYGISEESGQRRIHRSLDYSYRYRKAEYGRLSDCGLEYPELLPPPMDTIEQKKEGYALNLFQFWELNNIRDMELVSSIVDRRISKKNTTLKQIEYIDSQYCDILLDIQNSSDDRAFPFMAMFTLESKYSFDFIYEIADLMERNGITYSDELGKRVSAYCSRVTIDSCINEFAAPYPGYPAPVCRADAESRMLHPRRRFLQDILYGGHADALYSETHRFLEGLVVSSILIARMQLQGLPLSKWFCLNTDRNDWISVFDDYNVYGTLVTDKKWTRKTVRNLKSIYDHISIDYKS